MIRFFTSISAFIHDLLWTVSYKMTILHLHVALSRAAFGCLLEHVCSFWRTPPQCQLQILILWSFPVLCYFTIELRCREWCIVGSSNLILGRGAPEGGRSHHVIGEFISIKWQVHYQISGPGATVTHTCRQSHGNTAHADTPACACTHTSTHMHTRAHILHKHTVLAHTFMPRAVLTPK